MSFLLAGRLLDHCSQFTVTRPSRFLIISLLALTSLRVDRLSRPSSDMTGRGRDPRNRLEFRVQKREAAYTSSGITGTVLNRARGL